MEDEKDTENQMVNIAIAGFQHETNCFSLIQTTLEDFMQADCWPAYTKGDAILSTFNQMNIPISGFIEEAKNQKFNLEPLLWCSALPSGKVEQATFDHISAQIISKLKQCKNIDGVYLDLHGAMVTSEMDDPEGVLLSRVRWIVGPDTPIVASLDLHANVTPQMLKAANMLISYRTYPHVDMAETGKRAAKALKQLFKKPNNYKQKAIRQVPFKIALPFQSTMQNPAKDIYERLEIIEEKYSINLSLNLGFPLADNASCYPTLVGFGKNANKLNKIMDQFAEEITLKKQEFKGKLWSIDEAIQHAMNQKIPPGKPIIFADTQDNPGGGGSGDVMEIVKSLAKHNAKNAIAAIICDPDAAYLAHNTPLGKSFKTKIGGKTSVANQSPLEGEFTVKSIGKGEFTGTGPFYKGCPINLGPMALLSIKGTDVEIIVSSKKMQAADRAIFNHLNVSPAQRSIVCLKSSVHFRADFQSMASDILVVAAPGVNYAKQI